MNKIIVKNFDNLDENTQKFHAGFTLIEVILFIALSGALFAMVMVGVSSNVARERYRDATNGVSEFLRSVYSDVANVQNPREYGTYKDIYCSLPSMYSESGSVVSAKSNTNISATSNADSKTGRTDCAIYGKLVTFGENASSNTALNSQIIHEYDIIGAAVNSDFIDDFIERLEDDSDVESGSETAYSTRSTLLALKEVGADVVTIKDSDGFCGVTYAGNVRSYNTLWGSRLTGLPDASGNDDLVGAVMIVRSPISGTISTYTYQAEGTSFDFSFSEDGLVTSVNAINTHHTFEVEQFVREAQSGGTATCGSPGVVATRYPANTASTVTGGSYRDGILHRAIDSALNDTYNAERIAEYRAQAESRYNAKVAEYNAAKAASTATCATTASTQLSLTNATKDLANLQTRLSELQNSSNADSDAFAVSLAELQQAYAEAEAAYVEAQRNKNSADSEVSAAQTALASAQAALAAATVARDNASNALEPAEKNLAKKNSELDTAEAELNAAATALQNASAMYDDSSYKYGSSVSGYNDSVEDYNAASTAYSAAQQDYINKSTNYADAVVNYNTAQAAYQEAQRLAVDAQNKRDSALAILNAAQQNASDESINADPRVIAAQEEVNKAKQKYNDSLGEVSAEKIEADSRVISAADAVEAAERAYYSHLVNGDYWCAYYGYGYAVDEQYSSGYYDDKEYGYLIHCSDGGGIVYVYQWAIEQYEDNIQTAQENYDAVYEEVKTELQSTATATLTEVTKAEQNYNNVYNQVKKELSDAATKASASYQQALKVYNEAQAAYEAAMKAAEEYKKARDAAATALQNAESAYNTAKDNQSSAADAYVKAKADFEEKNGIYGSAEEARDAAQGNYNAKRAAYEAAVAARKAAQDEYDAKLAAYTRASSDVLSAQALVKAREEALQTAIDNRNAALPNYNAALAAWQTLHSLFSDGKASGRDVYAALISAVKTQILLKQVEINKLKSDLATADLLCEASKEAADNLLSNLTADAEFSYVEAQGKFESRDYYICVSSEDATTYGSAQRVVKIAQDGKNNSAVQMVDADIDTSTLPTNAKEFIEKCRGY